MEDLTLIDGEMMHGTYVTDGHRVRTIMTRQHMAMNERMVQQGIINNIDDGVQCVDTPTPDIHATTLVDYEVLSHVMDKVMKQITARSKYTSELRDKLTARRDMRRNSCWMKRMSKWIWKWKRERRIRLIPLQLLQQPVSV